ncbi:MAG: hypothetical protein ACHP8A_00075 [Terriglobales bacterium]|jgi:type 1 fimbria pilin|nr:hypothetical protein [Terriglobales bacterium]
MKCWIVATVFALLASGVSNGATFHGEISDSSCALNVHSLSRSHKEMLKSKSFGTDAASCSRNCVAKFAASFVLVEKGNVYRLDNQVVAEKFAGQAVVLTGDLDAKKSVITIKSIQPDHPAK